jgi:D-serine deaminase-like pyridoxal phosphate-dependent protein
LKTHKLPEITRRQLELGIRKCKVATIAEAEMAADAGCRDILLSMQPVGPHADRFTRLILKYPDAQFSAICDHPQVIDSLALAATRAGVTIELLVDLNIGQNRTGICPGEDAVALSQQISRTKGLRNGGLHAYDGHLHQSDPEERRRACAAAFVPVEETRDLLHKAGLDVPRIVAGGSPTFPFHAQRPDVECSPGTTVLWDAGYAARFGDLDYLQAAALLSRVVSIPTSDSVCLDLGYKALAGEMPHPRVIFPELADATVRGHNEEHLVLQTQHAERFEPGQIVYGIPWHVCPTVALQSEVALVRSGTLERIVPVSARARRLTI